VIPGNRRSADYVQIGTVEGALKMQDQKMQDLKIKDQISGPDIWSPIFRSCICSAPTVELV